MADHFFLLQSEHPWFP